YWSEALTQGAVRQIWNHGSGSTFNLQIGVEDYGPDTGFDVRTLEAWWQLGKDMTAPVTDWTNNSKNLAVYEVVEETMPTGMIVPFGGDVAPSGYLMCDGSEVDRGTYAALYAVIGDNYGNGNGVDTFNLPGSAGRVPQGRDAGIPDFDTLGNTGGEKDHQLSVAELAQHNHTVGYSDTSSGNGTYAHGNLHNTAAYTLESATTVNLNTGSNVAHNNMGPYFVTNYIIQT
ncbi:unnamed protein product, partial [marine sediment metagenome]